MNRRVLSEIALINLCRPESGKAFPGSMEARIARIEAQLENGAALPRARGTAEDGMTDERRLTGQEGLRSASPSFEGASGSSASDPSSAASSRSQGSGTPDAGGGVSRVVVPELFQRIASQWKQTMSSLPNRGRGEVLANCSEVSFSEDEPDTLFITLEDNWYRPLANDKTLLGNLSDAIEAKYGVRPLIRFVNRSQTQAGNLLRIGSRVEALQREGILFPIEVE